MADSLALGTGVQASPCTKAICSSCLPCRQEFVCCCFLHWLSSLTKLPWPFVLSSLYQTTKLLWSQSFLNTFKIVTTRKKWDTMIIAVLLRNDLLASCSFLLPCFTGISYEIYLVSHFWSVLLLSGKSIHLYRLEVLQNPFNLVDLKHYPC